MSVIIESRISIIWANLPILKTSKTRTLIEATFLVSRKFEWHFHCQTNATTKYQYNTMEELISLFSYLVRYSFTQKNKTALLQTEIFQLNIDNEVLVQIFPSTSGSPDKLGLYVGRLALFLRRFNENREMNVKFKFKASEKFSKKTISIISMTEPNKSHN